MTCRMKSFAGSRSSIGDRELALNNVITRLDLYDIRPVEGPIEMAYLHDAKQSRERRKRLVDLLASNFAHAITEALFEREKR